MKGSKINSLKTAEGLIKRIEQLKIRIMRIDNLKIPSTLNYKYRTIRNLIVAEIEKVNDRVNFVAINTENIEVINLINKFWGL